MKYIQLIIPLWTNQRMNKHKRAVSRMDLYNSLATHVRTINITQHRLGCGHSPTM